MIWHLAEVWLLVVLTFVVGCLAGAHLYGLLADSRFAIAQGIVADAIGDAADRVKARVGLAPAWRPAHLRHVERPKPEGHPEPDFDVGDPPAIEGPAEASRLVAIPADEPVEAARSQRGPNPAPTRRIAQVRRPEPQRLPVPTIAPPVAPKRPSGLAATRGGVPDNLQRIKGIGKRNEELLNGLGIFHFGQIAAWTPGEILWIGHHLTFPERIQRDNWVGQATLLAMGSETGFQKSAERRRERRRRERDFGARMANASAAFDGSADIANGFAAETLPPTAEDDAESEPSALADNDEAEKPR